MATRTPIFVGMTRPPEKLGMPVSFWFVGATVPMVAYILTAGWGFWALLLFFPSSIVMWRMARKDPYMFDILAKKLTKTPATLNNSKYGGNSYGP